MPKNVGKYQQGSILTHPEAPMPSTGVPPQTPLLGPTPKSPRLDPEAHNTAPNNDGHKV